MAKSLKDILAGVRSSKIVKAELGTNPGVDYKPKSKDEADFAASHSIEKHADRAGNDEGVFTAKTKYSLADKKENRHGHKKGQDEKVNEAVEKEDTKCNMSEAGTMCEVHGMNSCKKAKTLTEKDEDNPPFPGPYDKKEDQKAKDKNVAKNAARKAMKKMNEDGEPPMPPSRPKNDSSAPLPPPRPKQTEDKPVPAGSSSNGKRASTPGSKTGMRTFEEVEQVDEVLTKKDSAGKWIKDFVKSDNPKFDGKSKKDRTKQALAAYYSKQRDEAVEPLLGSADEDELDGKKKD